MTFKLFFQALTKFVLEVVVVGALLYVPVMALRIRNEEHVLERDLKGYKEYKQQVRYKVIPFIW